MSLPRPPLDPELAAALAGGAGMPALTAELIPAFRAMPPQVDVPALLAAAGIESADIELASFDGATIGASVLRRAGRTGTGTGPGLLFIHGGGMVMGDRWRGVDRLIDTIVRHDAVVVTVEYRLAPEHPDPIPVEDCFAALGWTASRADELGIDPARLLLVGLSAGGGLAAGTALLARDRSGPAVAGMLLAYPMIDDRDRTVSVRQFEGTGLWDREANTVGWTAYLGERRGTDAVSIAAAPARATDLSGLPPAFIDVGSAEALRDEGVAFASGIWAAGGEAELHVWQGGFHACESLVPEAAISRAMTSARASWLDRILSRP